MSVLVKTTLLLIAWNLFLTFAWYAHLNNQNDRKWYIAAIASWRIALFEYLLQVLANRIGYAQLSLAQLKITQEVITLSVFVPLRCFLCASLSSSTIYGRAYACQVPFTSSSGPDAVNSLVCQEISRHRWMPYNPCRRR